MNHQEITAIRNSFLKSQYKNSELESWFFKYGIRLCDELLKATPDTSGEKWIRELQQDYIHVGDLMIQQWENCDMQVDCCDRYVTKPEAAIIWPILKRYSETGYVRQAQDQAVVSQRSEGADSRTELLVEDVATGPCCNAGGVCCVQEDSFGDGILP